MKKIFLFVFIISALLLHGQNSDSGVDLCAGPFSNQKLRKEVADRLFEMNINAPFENINGQLHVPSDYGTVAHLSAKDCEAIAIQIPDRYRLNYGDFKKYVVSVYSPTGSIVYSREFDSTGEYTRTRVIEDVKKAIGRMGLPTSVYFISIIANTGEKLDAFKIFRQDK